MLGVDATLQALLRLRALLRTVRNDLPELRLTALLVPAHLLVATVAPGDQVIADEVKGVLLAVVVRVGALVLALAPLPVVIRVGAGAEFLGGAPVVAGGPRRQAGRRTVCL